jgi:DNA-binding MarR family transcriptional regulator
LLEFIIRHGESIKDASLKKYLRVQINNRIDEKTEPSQGRVRKHRPFVVQASACHRKALPPSPLKRAQRTRQRRKRNEAAPNKHSTRPRGKITSSFAKTRCAKKAKRKQPLRPQRDWLDTYAKQALYEDLKFRIMSARNSSPSAAQPDSHQVAWRVLLTAHSVLTRRVAQKLEAAGGISYDDYDVLLTLNEADGRRLRMSDLARLTLLSHSGISRAVTRLESEGLLKRERCQTDGRGYFAVLTKRGQKALKAAWPPYQALLEKHFSGVLKATEAEEMAALLHRVIVSAADEPPFNEAYPQRLTDEPL